MTQLFVNNFATTLTQTLGVADVYMHLASVAGLPVITGGDYILLTVFRKSGVQESGHEVVKVTSVVENQLTVERSVEGADASIFLVGDRVEARATAASFSAKADVSDLSAHTSNTSNPHGVTAAQVGLGNVPNLSFSGSNTGDETTATIKTKLGITTLSGSNTGDQVIPTTLPASDVSAWAKAATKPTYTAAEVGLGNVPNLSFSGSNTGDQTLSGLGGQPLDADLTAIAALAGTTGLLKKTAANTWSLDTTAYTTNLGTVTGVTGTAPIVSSGGTAPAISISAATTSVAGSMSAADKTKLDGIANNATANTGDVTLTGTQTLTNKTLTGYTETTYDLTGTDIAVSNGTIQTKTISANTTFTESLADGQSVILGITAGSYSVTWPSITWSKVGGSGTAPTLTSTGVNWVILWQVGGVLRGSFLGTA